MDLTQAVRASLVSRREALMLLGAMTVMRSVDAAEPGMLQPRITIKDFNAEAVKRVLGERGIVMSDRPGLVRVTDPDGIGIELGALS